MGPAATRRGESVGPAAMCVLLYGGRVQNHSKLRFARWFRVESESAVRE